MIRNSAKGIVIHNSKILLILNETSSDKWTTLPGGGQEKFETLKDALKRECLEETGYNVEVRDLAFIREYIGKNHEFGKIDYEVHQVEYMFMCNLVIDAPVGDSLKPDNDQVDSIWVSLDELDLFNLYPVGLRLKIKELLELGKCEVYLGDVN